MVEIFDYQVLETQDIEIASKAFSDFDVEHIEIAPSVANHNEENASGLNRDEFDRKDFRLVTRNDGSTYYVDSSTYIKKNRNNVKDNKNFEGKPKKFLDWFYNLFNS